jgi:phage terminase large subunit
MPLSEAEAVLYANLLRQEDVELVSPKLEAFRQPARIKGCRGGRGGGAKSWSIASLLIQKAHREKKHIACIREVQLTLEESVWKLMCQTIERLGYSGWKITRESLDHVRTKSHIIFRGLSDLRAAQFKSLESFDIFWLEEAQSISSHSLDVLMPTLRKPGSEIWFSMNPEEDIDPVIARLWNSGREDAILLDLLPGPTDNPWWTAELQHEMEADFKRDPDLAEHIWHGAPRVQGNRSVLSRARIRAAMNRDLSLALDKDGKPVGVIELGVDVARFGDDKTTIYKRCGMKVIAFAKLSGADTQEVARRVWDMADRDSSVAIKVDDVGVGSGVTDKLRDLGANVIPVLNGAVAFDTDKYTTCADEQWFHFADIVDSVDIPDDDDLMQELAGRQYRYTTHDQRKIESKADFKKRYAHSPDSADGLLLCFYTPRQGRVADYSAGGLGL